MFKPGFASVPLMPYSVIEISCCQKLLRGLSTNGNVYLLFPHCRCRRRTRTCYIKYILWGIMPWIQPATCHSPGAYKHVSWSKVKQSCSLNMVITAPYLAPPSSSSTSSSACFASLPTNPSARTVTPRPRPTCQSSGLRLPSPSVSTALPTCPADT